ncbi:hypothetical protein OCK74_16620 [Chitinophagaceae bacterium LB-8]|uniref:Uncharacterized protein n=1 Tax=Paraflavisolibacter caeni TaxID=2982496 RepID=A0A9X2XWL3_9BACT|nr:hypothetical protein [Paraflavisolibacter caeni]MCU7550744.1 hypothetical protein [Paraflavisolibacter caeni]
MQQLSPKKYIETKARSLPIFKCLVNKDWEESKMADVIVMRRHNNGNITVGIYLVDLLCLGIKDTFYFFNEPEDEVENRYGPEFYQVFTEIDYNLAHNIIYAGHDFAMEYEIQPHREFETTKFILEEDSDDIPLLDISVGSEDGKPHLIVQSGNQYPDVLAKLKRIAGEGNYYYTIGEDFDKEPDEVEMGETDYNAFDEDEEQISLNDIPLGEIDALNVQNVMMVDLMNPEMVKQRTMAEQVIINAECLTRVLPAEITELKPEEENRWDNIWNELLDQAEFPTGMNQEIMDDFYTANDELIEGEEQLGEDVDEEAFSDHLAKVLDAHSTNPMVVASMYETSTALLLEGVEEKAKAYVNELQQQYPYLQISLAMGALLKGTRDARFSNIYNAKTIKEALPQVKQFYSQEVINFWMVKMLVSLEDSDLKDAVQYYLLIRETQANAWLFESVLMKYNDALAEYFKINHIKG